MKEPSGRVVPVATALCTALIVGAFAIGGPKGGTGALLGVAGTAVSVWGTWTGIRWVGRIMADGSPGWHGAAAPVAALVIKLPVILAAMWTANRIGPPAPAWFLAGLALVYSALVWWAVSRH
ncbi:MAG: hypothetical protein JST30_06600 [Armatimonadetes bacterium]|nr:hypothetical protein [Armatimonadota bacterium]